MTRSETISWVKRQEWAIRRACERQISNEQWDGIIEGGALGVSVLEPFEDKQPPSSDKNDDDHAWDNVFQRDDRIYHIAFAGQSKRLKGLLGLDYLSVLLRYAGRSITAPMLQSMAAGILPDRFVGVLQTLDATTAEDNPEDGEGQISFEKSDFAGHEQLDHQARVAYKAEIRELDIEIVHAQESLDRGRLAELEKAKAFIEDQLKSAQDLHGMPRKFSDRRETARVSVKKAIQYAINSIRPEIPALADHLREHVVTGASLTYRDCDTRWKL
jgi:hypothetical protein